MRITTLVARNLAMRTRSYHGLSWRRAMRKVRGSLLGLAPGLALRHSLLEGYRLEGEAAVMLAWLGLAGALPTP